MEPSVALASISKSHAAVRKLAETTPILRVLYQGITVDVEKPPGFVQSGISPEGKAWTRVYGYRQDGTKVDGFIGYGCLPGTSGIDGEELDVYLGANAGAKIAFLIEQGAPDPEHKLMLGFPDAGAAIDCYLAHVPARMLAGVTAIPIALVQSLLACDEVAKSTSSEGVALRMLKEALDFKLAACAESAPVDLAKSDDAAPAFKVEAQFITKSIVEELRYVLGYVLEPLDGRAGEADTQGDFYTAETIRDAMWNYMKFFRNVSLNHKAYLNGRVFVVECWQTKNDEVIDGSQIRAGTWMLGINIVDDEIWGMVKRGELRALSIGGTAEKVPFAA